MSLFKLNFTPFFFPDEGVTTPAVDSQEAEQSARAKLEESFNDLDDDDDNDTELLGEEKETEDKTEDKEDEEKSETLEDELEETLSDKPKDKLEYVEPVRRREVLTKYPKLFKEFPYLEHAMYREQKYTEIFASPSDAEEAAEKAASLDNFEASLLNGELKGLFESVKSSDSNSFNKLVDNFLVDLGEVDQGAQVHIITNVAKHLVSRMLDESESSGQEVLKHAAIILNQFATGSSKFTPPQNLAQADKPKDPNLDKEREQFQTQQFNTTRNEVISRLDRKITATLSARLDPKDTMPEIVKEAASSKAKKELQRLIASDKRFQNVMMQAWQKAQKSNFAKSDVDLINRSYEQKAASLLPNIINKVRTEVLKGLGKRTNKESDEDVIIREPNKRGPVAPGRSAAPNSGNPNARGGNMKSPPNGMKIRDFLMQD